MTHRHSLGEEVELAFGFFDQNAVGTYCVTRLLPSTPQGEPQYRIKDGDGRERVIGEGQIVVAGKAAEPPRPRSGHNPITQMFDSLRDPQ